MAVQPKAVREARRLKAAARNARIPMKKKKGSIRKANIAEAHRAVVDAYFENGCVSQRRAMLAAGYALSSAKTPIVVFGREDVQAEIMRRRNLHERRATVTEERIMEEYAKLAFSNLGDLLEVNEDGSAWIDFAKLDEGQKAAMSEFQVETYDERDGEAMLPVKKAKVKFASKQAALDSLARIKGMFKDRTEISGVLSLVDRVQAARQRLQTEKK